MEGAESLVTSVSKHGIWTLPVKAGTSHSPQGRVVGQFGIAALAAIGPDIRCAEPHKGAQHTADGHERSSVSRAIAVSLANCGHWFE